MSDYIKVELTEEQYDTISRIGITKLEVTSLGCKMTIGGGSSDFEMTLMDKDRFNQPSSDSEAIDMIDTTSKQVDWKAGDECVYKLHGAIVVGWHPFHPVLVIDSDAFGLVSCTTDELSKPESPEQKAEKIRQEFIQAIWQDMTDSTKEPDRIDKMSDSYLMATRLFDKGYRQEVL